MIETKLFNTENSISLKEKQETIDFLYKHLDEFGDSREDISKAINFALKINDPSLKPMPLGGYILNGFTDNTLVCSIVVNKTGMSGYIPGNILVYIATHRDYRGQGIGRNMMKKALELAEGDVALHVEPKNPARHLYEKIGFTSKYLEMRYVNK